MKKRNKKYRPKPVINPWRRLSKDDAITAKLRMAYLLDDIESGRATPETLYSFSKMIYLWCSFVKDEEDAILFSDAHILIENMVDRYKRTGKIGMSGEEMQKARALNDWMLNKLDHVSPDQIISRAIKTERDVSKLKGVVNAGK